MSYEAIARRWARAIFDLGKETESLADLNRDVASFAELYAGNEELSQVLSNPLIPDAAREAIVREIGEKVGLSETAVSALRLLVQKNRMVALPEIARQLSRLTDEDASVVRAEVLSAGPLTESYLDKLRAELEKATGKKVKIDHKQDKSLIAGVVTRLGDQVIDGSLRARLENFKEALLRG
jgi:F-type H+-transporting ATPase subunit delta